MFRFDKLTQKAQEALQQSQAMAEKYSHQAVHPLHLLVSLATEKEGIVRPVLEKCGVQPEAIISEAERQLTQLPKVVGAASPGMQVGMLISPSMNQVLEVAFKEAERFKDEYVSTEHLLLAIAEQK